MEEKYKIHGIYIISILLAIIVILIAVEWSKVEGLINYITFALTLSSLILAILAIVYSIVSNTSLGRVLQNINTSSDSLKHTSEEIDESNKALLKEIKSIPTAIESVGKDVITTRSIVEELSFKQPYVQHEGIKEISTSLTNDMIKKFLDQSSIRGLESILCVVLSKKTNTAFRFDDICKKITELKNSEDYLFAYFIAISALGLFSYDHDGRYRYIVKDVNITLLEHTENILNEKINKKFEEELIWYKKQEMDVKYEEIKVGWFKELSEIKAYFGLEV